MSETVSWNMEDFMTFLSCTLVFKAYNMLAFVCPLWLIDFTCYSHELWHSNSHKNASLAVYRFRDMIKSLGIDEKIWLDFRGRSSSLYQYPFKFSLFFLFSFFASPFLALCRSLHRFPEYSSISFYPICLCFYRGFISGPFLLSLPLLLPEFLSVDSILSCGGFVSRFLPACYRFPFCSSICRM